MSVRTPNWTQGAQDRSVACLVSSLPVKTTVPLLVTVSVGIIYIPVVEGAQCFGINEGFPIFVAAKNKLQRRYTDLE
jgi:hypothetical protein